ncbi:acetyl-CoA C-acetyltransferase [Pimelobacter simplex]|uniref:Acetyl-CoA acetyltransferase, Mycobacterial subgroup fadA3 n=1 Tax=Nocardioides simplex TaxID=2045 RepID=A0A0A1DP98_NOCSI|nr:acetyl-CoA C-acetyltransferase [Pimelobacter simplex]AIY19241.1 acetyl-CoA acetyltransferase, Mycobacterial subgroup FadA3 [Pimelobacter simplex]MCG8149315.1 acetyl-CoA C-acetyltransferase [Pimelobacter simplex]GEB16555.1 acetyl-CoA acetyltransferase [Pimelobacter simplex]SFM20632.1 acetyl-CoA C-acetyltransferase [Pimelobacter simplex]
MPEAVIVSVARSPIGRAYKGSLKDMRPDHLAAQMVRAALAAVPSLDPAELDDLVMGCAQPAGEQGYNIGRMTALQLGYDGLPGATVHRYCASSLQAIRMAMHAIRAGEGDAFVAAGVETVSRFTQGKADGMPDTKDPAYADAAARGLARAEAGKPWIDPREAGELPDIYIAMGETAENVADLCGVSRAAQDEYAVRSQNLAEAAADRGFWEKDITPVTLPDGTVVSADDGPRRGVTLDKVAAMAPVFRPTGTVTAANCCPLNDGAAAVVVMSDVRARELGLTPLARIVSSGVSALSPEIMGLGPVEASRQALARAGMTVADVDLVEMNEAFAAQVLPSIDRLGLPLDKVNVNGGAIALGHPFGSTGARMATTLIHALQEQDLEIGMETMCAAGGQGMSLVLERLS